MASGTSISFNISNESLSERKSPIFSKVDLENNEVFPPKLETTEISTALSYCNPFPEFSFEKISYPDYGSKDCIAKHLGIPANKPEPVQDYHYIGLARSIDIISNPKYEGRIVVTYDTPKNTTPNGK